MKEFLRNIYIAVTGVFIWYAVILIMLAVMYPLALCAQEAGSMPPPMPDPGSFLEALSSQHWPLAVALGVTILVWFVRYVAKDKIPPKAIPYVMLACAVLSGGAARIIQAVSDNHTWWTAMIQGILEGATVGLGSMGMWSAGAKKVLPTPPKRE